MSELQQQQVDFYTESIHTLNEMKGHSEEVRLLTKKMRQTFNGLLAVAVACFLPLLYSFVSLNVTVGKLEEKVIPKDEVYNLFVQKVDALAVHMYEEKWIRTQLYKITNDEELKKDNSTKDLLKAFFKEETRSASTVPK